MQRAVVRRECMMRIHCDSVRSKPAYAIPLVAQLPAGLEPPESVRCRRRATNDISPRSRTCRATGSTPGGRPLLRGPATDGLQATRTLANADHPLTRELRIVVREKVEKPLQIGKRASRYLDTRHARARGRRRTSLLHEPRDSRMRLPAERPCRSPLLRFLRGPHRAQTAREAPPGPPPDSIRQP